MLVIRELTEGLFAGRYDPMEESDGSASDRLTITRATSEKLFEVAFAQAKLRRHCSTRRMSCAATLSCARFLMMWQHGTRTWARPASTSTPAR